MDTAPFPSPPISEHTAGTSAVARPLLASIMIALLLTVFVQEVGRWHQESLRRTWDHMPMLARDQLAVQFLKRYCEQHAKATDDPYAASYALLCRRIFGFTWDPANAFQKKTITNAVAGRTGKCGRIDAD